MLLTLSPRRSIFLHSHPPFLSTSGRRCPPPPLRACPLPTAGSLSLRTPHCGTFGVGNGIGIPPTHNPSSTLLPHTGLGPPQHGAFPIPLQLPAVPCTVPMSPVPSPCPVATGAGRSAMPQGARPCTSARRGYGVMALCPVSPHRHRLKTPGTCRRRLVPLRASCLARPRHWRGRGRRLRPRGLSVWGCCPPAPLLGLVLSPGPAPCSLAEDQGRARGAA